jgi:uncharacterized protein YukE
MPKTLVRPENVREHIRYLKQYVQKQQDALKSISDVINDLKTVWESDAEEVYTENFEATKGYVNDFLKVLESYIRMVEDSVDGLVDADKTVFDMLRKSVARG